MRSSAARVLHCKPITSVCWGWSLLRRVGSAAFCQIDTCLLRLFRLCKARMEAEWQHKRAVHTMHRWLPVNSSHSQVVTRSSRHTVNSSPVNSSHTHLVTQSTRYKWAQYKDRLWQVDHVTSWLAPTQTHVHRQGCYSLNTGWAKKNYSTASEGSCHLLTSSKRQIFMIFGILQYCFIFKPFVIQGGATWRKLTLN